MLAAVVLITEIDFHENDKTGVAEITDAAPYGHGMFIIFVLLRLFQMTMI